MSQPMGGRKGRLKIYLGFAAGVGKTYRMLEEAHALQDEGIDVVLGFVEPHGREETRELIEGLEVIPRKQIGYRGMILEEMDLDTLLERAPAIAIVDEVAHTNAPGSRHDKRWEDVVELLDHGIDVICAFNIQHLESLNDLVSRLSGVVIGETVPDSFLQGADQVVNLDLAVEDLLDRLRTGRIYPPDQIDRAEAHFFRDKTLASLRELSLREVAESVDRSQAPVEERRTSGRVLVCVSSSSPRALALLRRGSRIAGRLNTDWFAVYVETPKESLHRIDAGVQRELLKTMGTARELGAEMVRLYGEDPVETVVAFARTHDVALIVAGRTLLPWWRRLGKGSFVDRLVRLADDFDLFIVGRFEEEIRRRR